MTYFGFQLEVEAFVCHLCSLYTHESWVLLDEQYYPNRPDFPHEGCVHDTYAEFHPGDSHHSFGEH